MPDENRAEEPVGTEVTAEPVAEPAAESNEFETLADDMVIDEIGTDLIDFESEEPPAPAPTAVEPEGIPEPEPEPEPVSTPEPTDEVDTPEPESAAVEPAPEPAAEAHLTPEQRKERYEQYKANLEKYYQLPEELVMAVERNPGETLPKLLAQVHMGVMGQMQRFMSEQLPQHLTNVQERVAASERRSSEFFESWPQLKSDDGKHVETVTRLGKVWRQLNPQGSKEQFIKEVGAQALVTLGLHAVPPAEPPPPAPPPAHMGGGSAPIAPAPMSNAPANEFTIIAEEMIADG